MKRKLLITFVLLLASLSLLKAQTQYRSLGTGVTVDLGSATNWQSSTDGVTWSAATTAPTGLASGSSILIQATDIWANNLAATSIPTGVTLTINSNATLGTFSTTNRITDNGTLVFAGTATQYLPTAAAFTSQTINNLTINNPTTVSTASGSSYLTVNGVINLMAGQFNCNGPSNNTLYLKGSIAANGGLINATSYFTMSGTSAQSIIGTEFVNGQISKFTVNSGTGGSVNTTGALKVSNTLALTAGTLTLGGALTITGGTMTVGTGAINTQNNMVLMSGTAAQAIPASFFSSNMVNNLTIGNSTTGVTSASSLNIGISYTVTPLKSGITPLTVSGTATVGGTLTIGSFSSTPTSGQQFTVLSATAISGTFSSLVLPSGYTGSLSYSGTAVTLTVTPIPSSNANLSNLTTTAGTISPTFNTNTLSYTATVANSTSSITVTPTAQAASATIKVNGTAVGSGNASPAINLIPGNNTITIALTAQDGVTTKTYTLVVTRIPVLYTFDTGVPTNFTATGSTLTSSTAHIKNGSSLAWNVSNGAVLTASNLGITSAQTGNFSTSSAQFYVYNAVPSQDTLVFSFYTNGNPTPQRVGHMLLNYAGWRDYHRSYRFDYDNGQDIGSGFTLDQMTITYKPANASSKPTIYLDEFNMVGDANERQPGPHMQVDLNQFDSGYAFTEPLQYFLNTPPTTSPTASGQEQTDAATVQSQYPRSIYIPSGANVTTAENYVSGCGIYRNADGSINGTRGLLYLNNVDTLVKISNYVSYLTSAAYRNNDATAKSNLLLFTEYLLDQGLAEGGRNSIHTNDYSNCRNFPVGFLQAVKSGLLTDTLNKGIIKMLKWSNEYNIIYNSTGNQWVETDFVYLKDTFLLELAGYSSNVNDQVRDYYGNSNFLSWFTNTRQGIEDGIKPDGTGFHHQFNNIHYLYAWGVYADRANSLKGTVFKITQKAFSNMAAGYKTLLLQQSPGAALMPISLSGRYPLNPFTDISQTQFQKMVAVGGDIEGTTNDTGLAQLYNYIYQTNYYSVPTASFDSVYHYNYTSFGIKRKGNWIVAMKGFTNSLRGGEIFPSEKMNMYGRYQSNGALEVLYAGGNTTNGWILNGAGWDWNMYPGTTTVQLPWSSLIPTSTANSYQLQNNSFTGALSLGTKNGIFAMDFSENSNGNYVTNNLKFKKSVFVFDNMMVCLGTSISSTNNSNITSTNLFQAIDTVANFAPIYVNNATAISSATYSNTLSTSSGSAWMVTGQTTGYYIPKNGGTVTVLRGSQTTPDQSDVNQTIMNTANYSKAYISHDNAPTNATYQYVVVPGTTPAAMQTLASSLDSGTVYSVLKQTDSLHAVFYKPDSTTSYAFFAPNNNVNIGYVKSISNKGLLGIRKSRDTLFVTINNPDLNVVTDASDAVDGWHSTPQNINLVLNGNWVVTANNSGASISSANNTLTAGFTLKDGFSGSLTLVAAKPPLVTITAPANKSVVVPGSNLTINTNTSTPNTGGSIAKVDFYSGSTLLGTSTAAPYSYTWNNVVAGKDTLKVVATDNFGLTTTSLADTIIVATPPTIAVTAPANNAVVVTGSSVTIAANASSPNAGGSIAKVDFYNGSTLLGTSTTAPYSYTWNNVVAGKDTLKVVATDNFGLTTTSLADTIIVATPPTIAITAPANNAVVVTGSSVTIAANASSPNAGGSIAKVDFYNGSTLLGTSTTAPYSYTWNNVVAGRDTLKAIATDNNGLTATSAGDTITVATPPTVAITSPANNSTVVAGSNIVINANASSPNTGGSIAKVDFYNGSVLLGTSASAPYTFTLNNVAAGTDSLKAIATDNNGFTTTSAAVVVTVANAPVVAITSPANNSTVVAGSNIVINANASSPDTGGSIVKVDFYNGSVLLGTSVSAPYSYTWNNVAAGTDTLTAVATDNNGFTTTSAAVVVFVNQPPMVALVSPLASTNFNTPANVTISANASDADGTISKVEFFQGAVKLGEVSAAPYTFNWTNVPAGNYVLTAKATDNGGATTVSAAVNITVAVPPVLQVAIPDVYALNPTTDDKNTIYIGYGPTSLTLNPTVTGDQGYTYSWSNGASTPSITVSQAGTYTVTVSSANGGQGTASITISTLDVRCGVDNTKVMVCHNQNVICVASSAVSAHLNHGDNLGSCSVPSGAHNNALANDLPETDGPQSIAVYPNPLKDVLHISVPGLQPNAVIHVFSSSAKEVRTVNLTQSTQDISFQGLAPGFYFLVINNGNQVIKKKLIKY